MSNWNFIHLQISPHALKDNDFNLHFIFRMGSNAIKHNGLDGVNAFGVDTRVTSASDEQFNIECSSSGHLGMFQAVDLWLYLPPQSVDRMFLDSSKDLNLEFWLKDGGKIVNSVKAVHKQGGSTYQL